MPRVWISNRLLARARYGEHWREHESALDTTLRLAKAEVVDDRGDVVDLEVEDAGETFLLSNWRRSWLVSEAS